MANYLAGKMSVGLMTDGATSGGLMLGGLMSENPQNRRLVKLEAGGTLSNKVFNRSGVVRVDLQIAKSITA